jgi:hypothetical protein
MGGILSKTLISSAGERLWNDLATVPLDQINAAREDRVLLRLTLFFEPLPFIGRMVFVAVPHRGSGTAAGLVGAMDEWLITLPPETTVSVDRVLRDNPDLARSDLRAALSSGVDLSGTSPVLAALTSLPIRDGLPYHSIMGDVTGEGPPTATDGVVDWESSHLEGAVSELVVPADHSVQRHPLAILEILRILREHVGR